MGESFSPSTGHGIDRYASDLFNGLVQLTSNNEVSRLEIGRGRSLPSFAWNYLSGVKKLLEIKAGLYHSTSQTAIPPAVVTRKHPLIVTIHDMIPYEDATSRYTAKGLGTGATYQKWILRLCNAADLIIAPVEATAQDIHRILKIEHSRISVIHWGIDHERFYSSLKFDESYKFPRAKKILYLGGVNKNKGIDTLIDAFNLLNRKDIELVVGGKGPHLIEMKQKVHNLNLDDRITFLGYVPEEEMRKIYNSCDLFVFPSRLGFGLMIFEAIAAGLPCIMSGTDDNKEIFGDKGIFCDQEDPNDIKNKIERLIGDEEHMRKSLKAQYEIVKKHTSLEIARQTLSLYQKVVS